MSDSTNVKKMFDLSGRVVLITGGAGFLGRMHAEAIAEAGGTPVLADVDGSAAERVAGNVRSKCGGEAIGLAMDVCEPASIEQTLQSVLKRTRRLDALVNNAARNPKVEANGITEMSRLENYPIDEWNKDLAVGLTGTFLCSRILGGHMANNGGGAIVNISSDLGLIGPDQRIYSEPGTPESARKKKPVSYSVVKGGLIMLTKYLATYWADKGVRVNSLCPGGIENGQPAEFVTRLSNLIPMGRMARSHEYKGAVVFLCSEASAYMTGSTLVIDGGRTAW